MCGEKVTFRLRSEKQGGASHVKIVLLSSRGSQVSKCSLGVRTTQAGPGNGEATGAVTCWVRSGLRNGRGEIGKAAPVWLLHRFWFNRSR